jgi:hypothetical protein
VRAPVYSKRLLEHPYTSPNTAAEVPDGVVWIVTNITAVPRGADAAGWTLFVMIPTVGIFALWALSSANPAGLTWEGRMVIYPGEQLEVVVGVGSWDVICTGYELTQ